MKSAIGLPLSAVLVLTLTLTLTLSSTAGCGDTDEVSSEEEARLAYLGLDKMVEKAMDLGFKGFNAATSANIPTQKDVGDTQGTITVTGKVDQGSSNNKGMRLEVALKDYSDDQEDPIVIYNTTGARAALTMNLKKIPTGDMSGTLIGTFAMTGELQGDVALNLTLSSKLEADSSSAGGVRRKKGTIRVTGTATSPYGVYAVDVSG